MSERKHTPGYETETLDRLFLELSQFTSARTSREIAMLAALNTAVNWFTPPNDSGPFPLKQITDAIAKATAASPPPSEGEVK